MGLHPTPPERMTTTYRWCGVSAYLALSAPPVSGIVIEIFICYNEYMERTMRIFKLCPICRRLVKITSPEVKAKVYHFVCLAGSMRK